MIKKRRLASPGFSQRFLKIGFDGRSSSLTGIGSGGVNSHCSNKGRNAACPPWGSQNGFHRSSRGKPYPTGERCARILPLLQRRLSVGVLVFGLYAHITHQHCETVSRYGSQLLAVRCFGPEGYLRIRLIDPPQARARSCRSSTWTTRSMLSWSTNGPGERTLPIPRLIAKHRPVPTANA